jgi:hypothetical protein
MRCNLPAQYPSSQPATALQPPGGKHQAQVFMKKILFILACVALGSLSFVSPAQASSGHHGHHHGHRHHHHHN